MRRLGYRSAIGLGIGHSFEFVGGGANVVELYGGGGCGPLLRIISLDSEKDHKEEKNQPQNASGQYEAIALIKSRVLIVTATAGKRAAGSAGAGGGVLVGEV